MQKGPSQVSSGNIAPTVVGPQKDTKDVLVLAGLVLFLSALIAAAWFYGQTVDQAKITSTQEKVDHSQVSEILKKAGAMNQAEASTASIPATAPVTTPADIIHTDVYFEVGRQGLTDEGKTQLTVQAELLKNNQDYGVLIQGYTDQQGSAIYNMKLGLRRAETVKTELLKAGVAEQRMKVVSLGEEGVLCVDKSDICRHMNRRVHLEIRKIGQEHMTTPAGADPVNPTADPTSFFDNPFSPSHSSQPDDPTTTVVEPASGS